jgi:hypothetical protein
MKHRKPLERRTFTQDRFDILIKRQKSGKATFNELTELDEIVNRDPAIRESVLIEMQEIETPADHHQQDEIPPATNPIKRQTLIEKITTFLNRLLISHFNRVSVA